MGNTQSYCFSSLAVCSVYLVYVHIYCSHKLMTTKVLSSDRLPSLGYLYIRYVIRALKRRTGKLYTTTTTTTTTCEVVYTVLKCRLEDAVLRSFCSAGGYGWDYPDTEYRDIPLCFPEFLCGRLLQMAFTDDNFRLSPAGLVHVCQNLKTLQPIDELKKGPFTLQVRVLQYRQTDAGVEVDVCLSATSRSGCTVWENVLTLLSKNKLHNVSRGLTKTDNESLPDEPVPENMKLVELRVPRFTDLQSAWSFSASPLCRLLSLPARLFGCRSQTAPSLWMLSVCLAEIEKHKGVEVITAPVNVTVQFKEPLLSPSRVAVRFWETVDKDLSFHMQQYGSNRSHMVGRISRS